MFRPLLTAMLKAGEKYLGVGMEFGYHMRDVAPGRLWRFSLFQIVQGKRQHTPADVFHAAGLAASMAEDCGPCTQIHVNLAQKDKVSSDVLRNLVARRLDRVPADVATAFRFGDKVSRGEPADEEREAIRARWGEKALIELAFMVASARYYPALKRGMGFAHTCERVVVANETNLVAKIA